MTPIRWFAAGALVLLSAAAFACTRVAYLGPDGNIVTARSMDW